MKPYSHLTIFILTMTGCILLMQFTDKVVNTCGVVLLLSTLFFAGRLDSYISYIFNKMEELFDEEEN